MDIAAWLRELGLERYAQALRDNEIDADVLPELTDADLQELGIPLGPRKKLLKAIRTIGAPSGAALAEPAGLEPEGPLVERRSSIRAEAERRQLTVLFCDLVGSTALSTQLDPEDLGAVISDYYRRCAEAIGRWDGHVARHVGDGVLAYFGYPKAYENAAERAVRAGLELTAAIARMEVDSHPLAVRIGIATGLVMIGDLVGEGVRSDEVVGKTPNLAARLQALAKPHCMVVAPATRRLIGDLFETEDLGLHEFKGLPEPVRAYRVEAESSAVSRFEALCGARMTPLIGRDNEVRLLLDRWAHASEGEGQIVLLSAEPGIGKSRIVRALRDSLADRPHVSLSHYCSPFHANTVLHPVIEHLQRVLGLERDDSAETKLAKLEARLAPANRYPKDAVPLVASLLGVSIGDSHPPLDLKPQEQQRRTLELLVERVEVLAAEQPVLVVYEDVQWADPSTLQMLTLLIEQVETLPVLVVITSRPDFASPWAGYGHITQLSLTRLTRRHGGAVMQHVAGDKALPAEVAEQILTHADGVPLFIEELTKAVLESGFLRDSGDRFELQGSLPQLAIPTSLRDSLMARLDRLAQVKEVAQIGAVIGREFSHDLLAAVVHMPEDRLNQSLEQLIASELVFRSGMPPDATYVYKHALVQDAAYQSLLKSRRQYLHLRIAEVLRAQFPEIAEAQPELLARHCTEAGRAAEAVTYWRAAGIRAAATSAHAESAHHFAAGLKLLNATPEGAERDQMELDLQLRLGFTMMASKGFGVPEVERCYWRAVELSEVLGESEKQFTARFGLWRFHITRGELQEADQLATQLEQLATRSTAAELIMVSDWASGVVAFWLGQLDRAREHLERAVDSYRQDRHGDLSQTYLANPGLITRLFLAWTLWGLGYPVRALATMAEAIAIADEAALVHGQAWASVWAALLHFKVGDIEASERFATRTVELTETYQIPHFWSYGVFLRGCAAAARGDLATAIADMERGLDRLRALGNKPLLPCLLALYGEALARDGRANEALASVAAARVEVEATSQAWCDAEIHRIKGEILRRSDRAAKAAAEDCFRQALEIAHDHGALAWELRAATSLARVWIEGGQQRAAHDLLAPIYDRFTEGLDTADLKAAKVLLDQLC